MKQPTVSIISAGLASMSDHFPTTARAVLTQSYGDFEWLVESDGTGPSLPDIHPDLTWLWADPRVHHEATGIAGGAAVARTSALSRARGRYVWVMDIDDIPEPYALTDLVAALEDSNTGWVQGVAADLTPEGLVEHSLPPGFTGPVPQGAMRRHWNDTGALAVHTVGMLMRTDLVAHTGGWYGLVAGEDTGMVLALSDASPGVVVPHRTLQYRKWDAQTTASPWYATTRALNRKAIANRTNTTPGRLDRLGICSPVRGCDLAHIDEFHASLADQTLPWHWYVATSPEHYASLCAWASRDPRITVIETARVGTRALAKNMALAAATEEVLLCADPFDVCGNDTLAELHEAVSAGAAYAIPAAVDIGTDCPTTQRRILEPGELVETWFADPHHWPVLSTWMATTASRLWHLGGHPAVSISEDAYLAALLGATSPGVLTTGRVTHRPALAPHATALIGPARQRVQRIDELMFTRARTAQAGPDR